MSFYIEGKIISINEKCTSVFYVRDQAGIKKTFIKQKHNNFSIIPNATIIGYYVPDNNTKYRNQYRFNADPTVIPNINLTREDMIFSLTKVLSTIGSTITAKELYDHLATKGNPLVIIQKAIVFPEERSILRQHFTDDQINRLLDWWIRNQGKVFLLSIGISLKKIERMDDSTLQKLYQNPFIFYDINIIECISLCNLFGIAYTDDDVKAGEGSQRDSSIFKDEILDTSATRIYNRTEWNKQ